MTMAPSSRSENGAQPCDGDGPYGAHSFVRVNTRGSCKKNDTSGILPGCDQSVDSPGNVVYSCMKACIHSQQEALETVRRAAPFDPLNTSGKPILLQLQNLKADAHTRTSELPACLRTSYNAALLRLAHVLCGYLLKTMVWGRRRDQCKLIHKMSGFVEQLSALMDFSDGMASHSTLACTSWARWPRDRKSSALNRNHHRPGQGAVFALALISVPGLSM